MLTAQIHVVLVNVVMYGQIKDMFRIQSQQKLLLYQK